MSTKRKLEFVDCSAELSIPIAANWQKCIICQEENGEALLNATETGLRSLGTSIVEFHELNALPRSVPFDELNKNNDVTGSLISHSAKYHKDCRSKLNKWRLKRKEDQLSKLCDTNLADSSKCTRSQVAHDIKSLCLFCDEDDSKDRLSKAQTFEVGESILSLATQLCDKNILSKLSSSDLIAQEAKYHKICYVQYRAKARGEERRNSKEYAERTLYNMIYGSSLSQTASYILDAFSVNDTSYPVFRLNDLKHQMENRMKKFGVTKPDVYRTKLKDDLLQSVPSLSQCKSGKEVLLYFEQSTGQALRDATHYSNATNDGVILANAAKIIRRDLFREFPKFTGSFTDEFQSKNCVSKTLVLLLQMILDGSSLQEESVGQINAAISLAELVRFNAVKYKRKNDNCAEQQTKSRHSVEQETPLPVYIGLKLYSSVRSKNLIQNLHALGLCISYDRVHSILSTITNIVCESYEASDCVLPPSLYQNIFSSAVIDNIDHNQSSTTAETSFHGTSITLIQHPDATMPIKNSVTVGDSKWSKELNKELPQSYVTVSPLPMPQYCDMPLSNIVLPVNVTNNYSFTVKTWLSAFEKLHVHNSSISGNKLSWSAFTSQTLNQSQIALSNHVLLPLINEKIQTPAMIGHCLKTIKNIYDNLNLKPNVPIITGDQPIYAIAKQLQWQFPDSFGESKMVIMLGGLHIEMAIMSLIGAWLKGSGWTEILVDSGVASIGQAESFLSCSHVKRSRYAHQVTVAALTMLQYEAYENSDDETGLKFDEWCESRKKESANFLYWSLTMDLEVLLLSFIQSIREGNFENYKKVLADICPWMFAMDRTNYARWLPVFVKTLQEIEVTHPSVYKEFLKGKFVSQKTNRSFSAMANDQLHEQNNRKIKEIGGAIGLLDSPSALLKWMVGGPEVVKMISDFEKCFKSQNEDDLGFDGSNELSIENHRENTRAFEQKFFKNVLDVVASFQKYGNPFETDKLLTAVSNICMSEEAEKSVREAEKIGKSAYEEFVQDRLVQAKASIHSVIKRNNLSLFAEKKLSGSTKQQLQIKNLKKDANVFCRLYVASQTRDSDISKFFAHENHAYPPSISEFGKLRKPPKKSDIITCLTPGSGVDGKDLEIGSTPCSANVIDGAALIHTLNKSNAKTFAEFSTKVFQSVIKRKLQNFDRVDIVFDRYLPGSIKSDTREKRDSCERVYTFAKKIWPIFAG